MIKTVNELIHTDWMVISLTILLCYSLYKVLSKLIHRIFITDKIKKDSKQFKRGITIIKLIQSMFRYLIFIIATLIILSQMGVNIKTIIAGLGIGAIIFGLAFQDVIKDLIAGINIITDSQFFIGEIIQIGLFKGQVIEIGLRNTRIKNTNGDIKIVANRNITDVINFSIADSIALLDICVPYEIDEDKIKKIIGEELNEKIKKIPDARRAKTVFYGIQQLEENHYVYRIGIPCKPNKNLNVQRAALGVIKDYCKNNKIKLLSKELI